MTKGTKRFSNPQALSSTLAVLGTLQLQTFCLLNRLVPLVLASNYYVVDCNPMGNFLFTNSSCDLHTYVCIQTPAVKYTWLISTY